LLIIAFINGTIREFVCRPYLGDVTAHKVSTAVEIALFGIFIWYIGRQWSLASARQALIVGLI
jgi:hypothetical protein